MTVPRIMLIDESEFFLGLARQYFKDSDVEVISEAKIANALDAIRLHKPDLIFLDIGAPAMEGLQVCLSCKKSALLTTIPIIMFYGRDQPKEKQRCLDAGCQGVLSKPFERRSFLAMGRKFLPIIDRRETRVFCSTAIFFRSDSCHHYAASLDISCRGMYIETDYPGKRGEVLDLAFNLPGQRDQVVELCSRVVWVNAADASVRSSYPVGFGVEFVSLPGPAGKWIQNYIEHTKPPQGRFCRSGIS